MNTCQGEATQIELSWSNRRLARDCATDARGLRRWGGDNWRLLKRRLASLEAAPTLEDMSGVPGNCHALGEDRAGQFAVHLWGQYRLVFEPDDDPIPRLPDGGIDRNRVRKIVVLEVVDYHD